MDTPATPYYHLVPKTRQRNLEFRKRLIREGSEDREAAEELFIMCARDPLFYINAFCWTYDPRLSGEKRVPMITYWFQDRLVMSILGSLGYNDLLVEKSRDEGASICCVLSFEWKWHFHPMESFLMVSRKQRLVQSDDPRSLFYKIDFAHDWQPGWLLPNMERKKSDAGHLENLDNGSTIDGEATTGDVAAGDRRTGVLLDEFARVRDDYSALASTRDVTRTRIFNSTPQGQGNAFYEMTQDENIPSMKLHWSQDPRKNDGMYTFDSDGELHVLDSEFDFDDDYEFRDKTPTGENLKGRPRSPWYDHECDRAVHPQEIAQELDIDYLGSSYQFFDTEKLEQAEKEDVLPPFHIGMLDYDVETAEPLEWVEREGAPIMLWTHLQPDGSAPSGRKFGVGCDVASTGTASHSTMSIVDLDTGEKIGEYASHNIMPHQFAPLAVAVCRFFNDAKLVWEANGPGQEFKNCVKETGYSRIYYRENERSMKRTRSESPGWYSTPETKRMLLGDYRRSLGVKFVNRSRAALGECRQYVFLSNGRVEHSRSANSEHPTDQGKNHGDRVIADALACRLLLQNKGQMKPGKRKVPASSLAARMNRAKQVSSKGYY